MTEARIGLIGGSGALQLLDGVKAAHHVADTPYGPPSSEVWHWRAGTSEVYFIARHGRDGTIAPHSVNYRANVWALHTHEPDFVLGINAVGGICPGARPGRLVIPDQLIDYTWGREHSFVDGADRPVEHAEFTAPFTADVRQRLLAAAGAAGLDVLDGGVYGATQGPRLETAAEIDRLDRDGCDIVGMTAMPEAALARELGMRYAICAFVVNWAAGRDPSGAGIHAGIAMHLRSGLDQVRALLVRLLASG